MPNCPLLQRLSQTSCAAGRQYGQHTAAVTAICLLPAHCQLAASRDAAGALHLWSIATGAQAACFPCPGLPPQASGRQGGNAARSGWLPTRRLQAAAVGVQRPAAQGLAAAGASGDGVQEQLTASRCENETAEHAEQQSRHLSPGLMPGLRQTGSNASSIRCGCTSARPDPHLPQHAAGPPYVRFCDWKHALRRAPVGYTCLAALKRGGGLCLAAGAANEMCALCRAPVGSGRRSSALAASAWRPAPQIVGSSVV